MPCRSSINPHPFFIRRGFEPLSKPPANRWRKDVTDYGQSPPFIRVLVWLAKPVPLRGEPCLFGGLSSKTFRTRRSLEHVLFSESSSILVSQCETSKSTWDAVWAKRVHRMITKIGLAASELRTFSCSFFWFGFLSGSRKKMNNSSGRK